jgi:hypothetical protein
MTYSTSVQSDMTVGICLGNDSEMQKWADAIVDFGNCIVIPQGEG